MNGRTYRTAATAVDRTSGPVLAWNVEPTQFPAGTYPEMPAAAAAAVSPVVPAAATATAPPDPYGRCWQNQVDPSACFPYFGTLYGSSLPPPSYRMQPGCLSNLGQFWPPTPPPEGCLRYDGANNLHYCSPLTPVFRHGESLSQNMLGVHQRLGHYSHLIDINKDASLKRIDCLDGIQRQKMLLASKHSKEVQQRVCSCYECSEKNLSRGTTPSVNKENISSGKLLDQKLSEDKLKSRSCKKAKDENFANFRNSATYHPTVSAIHSYACPMKQNVTRTPVSMQGPNQSDFLVQNSQKVENPVSNGNCVQHEFLRPESNSFPISRCAANSIITSAPSKDVTHIVQSTAKSSEQTRYDNMAEKISRHKLQVSTPGYESCACPQEQASSSSNSRRSAEKSCCFSPPHVSSRTLYHNYPENASHNKTPNVLLMYGNGYNASPLKNVYFSYYESENFDMGSGATSRKSKGNVCKLENTSNINSEDNHVQIPSTSQDSYVVSSANSGNIGLNGNFPCRSQYDNSTVPDDSYGCMYQSSCIEQQKSSSSSYLGSSNIKNNNIPMFAEQMAKIHSVHIKQEKGENMDCKYQKSRHGGSSNAKIAQLPDAITSNGVLNLSTSIRCPKIEPDDQINPSTNDLMRTSFGMPVVSCSLSVGSAKSAEACSQILKTDDTSSVFYSAIPMAGHMMKCHKVPDATTPQMHELESDCTPAAVPEDLCPIVQKAPSGGAESAVLSKMPTTGYEAPAEVVCQSDDLKESCSTSRNDCDGSNSAAVHHLERQESSHSTSEDQSSSFEKKCTDSEVRLDDHQPTSVSMEESATCYSSQSSHVDVCSKLTNASTLNCYASCAQPQSQNDESAETSNCEIIAEKKAVLLSIKTEVEEEEEKPCSQQTKDDLPVLLSEVRFRPEFESVSDTCAKSETVKSEDCCVKKECADHEIDEQQQSGAEERCESTPVEECHGLYVLLQGIAHKDNFDSSDSNCAKQTGDQTGNLSDESSPVSFHDVSSSTPMKMKGLNLLCALAEEQFFVEFGDGVNSKGDVSLNDSSIVNLSSNYPEVKDDDVIITSTPLSNEESERKADSMDDLSTELKMRKRLAELQQKYKEKQRELARLRPKKGKSLPNLEMSHHSSSASDISCTSLNSCYSTNCSKGNASVCEGSIEKSCHLSGAQSPCNEATLQEDGSPKSVKSQKISTRYSSKFSPEESCSGSSTTNSDSKADVKSTVFDRNSLRNRSKPVSKCMERLNVARRRLELRRNLRSNVSTSAKVRNSPCNSSGNSIPQTESSDVSDGVKILAKRQKKFSKRKVLRSSEKSNPESSKPKACSSEEAENFSGHTSRSPKKRKPENPKKFMPAKQVRLTETIVAKQLRNRILFESPECVPKKSNEKNYDVPEELFDAMRKCHLGEGSQSCENKQTDIVQELESQDLKPVTENGCLNGQERALKMTTEYLVEDQRILAIDEGLFYAGCIKEVQSPDVYSIVLDGQRGNKKHLFSQEEMLSQTILESKPLCLDELPEGTRVCAYWSHQYRCLYPGTVVRAPAPSPDWSEPRVFVEFDDGDSAQIAMKNIRFLPADLKISEDDAKEGSPEVPPFEFKEGISECKGFGRDQRKRKRPGKGIGNHSKLNKSDFSNGKANTSCCSNESNTEEYCKQEAMLSSPSQRLDEEQLQDRQLRGGNAIDTKISRRTQKQLAKKRSGTKSKVKENSTQAEKSKKHKRYKDRHKHHHHHRHHHRHHRHCHHHRHCKKRKHHKRASNVDNIINVVIPSSSIPFSNLIAKSTRSSMKDAEAQCVGHSKKEGKQLPQPTGETGDSKSVGTSTAKGNSRKESTALNR